MEWSEELSGGLLQAAPDAILVMDAGRIVLVNDRAEELFGWPRADLLGQHADVLITDAARAAYPELLQAPPARPAGRADGHDHRWTSAGATAPSSRSRRRWPSVDTPQGRRRGRGGPRLHRPAPGRGRAGPAAPGGAGAPQPAAGEPRPAGRRHRARLQQHARRDRQLRELRHRGGVVAGPRPGDHRRRRPAGDPGRRARHRPDPPAAGLRPPRGGPAAGAGPQRGDHRRRGAAAAARSASTSR